MKLAATVPFGLMASTEDCSAEAIFINGRKKTNPMAILPEKELKKQILEFPDAFGLALEELVDHYDAKTISRERLIENVKRSVETMLAALAESVGISLEEDIKIWGETFD